MLLNQRPSEPAAGTPVPAPGSAHDRVYRALRTRIMHGEIMPGASLTLRGIGRDYGVSMTPARESVRRLVAEGALMLSSRRTGWRSWPPCVRYWSRSSAPARCPVPIWR